MICGIALDLSTTAPLLSGPPRERVNVGATAHSLQYECKSNGGCYEHAGIAEGLTKPVTAFVDCFMLRWQRAVCWGICADWLAASGVRIGVVRGCCSDLCRGKNDQLLQCAFAKQATALPFNKGSYKTSWIWLSTKNRYALHRSFFRALIIVSWEGTECC